jgi:hypothetical protein
VVLASRRSKYYHRSSCVIRSLLTLPQPVITPLETKTNNTTDEEDDDASSDEEEQELAPPPSQVPLVLDDVKPLSALTSAPPSPLVMYNIIEAL